MPTNFVIHNMKSE